MVEIFFERVTPGLRQRIFGLRLPAGKTLGTGNIPGFFQFSSVNTDIAVRCVQKLFQLRKSEESFAASALTIPSRKRS